MQNTKKSLSCYKNLFDKTPRVDGLSVCHWYLETLATPILSFKNLSMGCHSSASEILRFLSFILSFCYRHLSTIFSHLIWNTWNTLTSRKDNYDDSAEATLFCKMHLGLTCETLSRGVLPFTCALLTLNHSFYSERTTEAWHRKQQGDQ